MKKVIKIANIVLIIAMLMLVLSNTVMASSDYNNFINDITDPSIKDPGKITILGQKIISYISIIAVVIAVVVLLILGIKYMIGSASEKAEYKKTMIPYLVGAVLVFGAGSIAQVIIQIASNLTTG